MLKNVLNKKGKVSFKTILVILLLIGIAAAVYFLLSGGFGLGTGNGGGGNASSAVSQSASAESELSVEELEYLEVTVTDEEYLYQNNKIELDALIEKLAKDASGKNVKVTDNNASKRAYEKLIEALKENNIRYIES